MLVGERTEGVGAEVDEGFHVLWREAGGGCDGKCQRVYLRNGYNGKYYSPTLP